MHTSSKKFDLVIIGSSEAYSLGTQIFARNTELMSGVIERAIFVTDSHIHIGKQTIRMDSKLPFNERVLRALKECHNEYVILALDDMLFTKLGRWQPLLSVLADFGPNYVSLTANPRPKGAIVGHPVFSITTKQSPYRLTTQPSCWRRDVCKRIFEYHYQPGDFERKAGIVHDELLGLTLGARVDVLSSVELVKKGKVKKLLACLYNISTGSLTPMPLASELSSTLRGFLNRAWFRVFGF